MSPVDLVEHESGEQELALLIREARLRQRRRRRFRVFAALTATGLTALAAVAATGALSSTGHLAQAGRPSAQTAAGCPSAAARSVANGALTAVVLGDGEVRLAVGNVYLRTRRTVVLGKTGAPGWSAIEAVWVVRTGYRGSLTIRGTRLQRPGPIAVQPAVDGLHPGSRVLTLSPDNAETAAGGLRLYPGSIWVRSAGCYALKVSGRGLRESIVFDAQAR